MKVKHYVYARIVTALLSTSALATFHETNTEDFFKSSKVGTIITSKAAPFSNGEQLEAYKSAKVSLAPELEKYDEQMASNLKMAATSLEEIREQDPAIAGFTLNSVKDFGQIAALSYTGEENRRHITATYRAQGYDVKYFSTDAETSGMVMIKGNKIIVAYHGTESLRNVATDLWGNLVTSSFGYGRYHQGFYEGFKKTWDEIFTIIHTYSRQKNIDLKDLEMVFTGHSLGGALAGIGATRWAEKVGADKVSVISFGAPKFCDTEAARRIESLFGARILRVTQHGYDIVPGVGPGIMGYTHVGQNLRLSAENWGDMHIMGAYNRLLGQMKGEEFVAKETARLLFRGGYYNPINIADGIAKGLNEMVLGNVHKAFAGAKRKIFGSTKHIENALEKSDKEADEHIKKQLIRHYEQNLKLLGQDKASLKKEMKALEKQAKSADSDAAQKLELNKNIYAQIKNDLKQLEAELKQIKHTNAHEVAEVVREEAAQQAEGMLNSSN